MAVKQPLDILIVGGGIGGQTLALALHATGMGHRIRVHEAAPTLMPLGVGINLQPHAIRELAGLGLLDDLARVGIEAREFAYFTHHGQLVYREPSGLFAGYKYPHFSIHRGDLLMVLYGAAKARIGAENIVTGERCVAVEQDAAGVTAHFVDPQGRQLPSRRADIIIACDGIHSAVRKQFYPAEGPPVFHGINFWRGLTRGKPFLTGASVTRVGGSTPPASLSSIPSETTSTPTGISFSTGTPRSSASTTRRSTGMRPASSRISSRSIRIGRSIGSIAPM